MRASDRVSALVIAATLLLAQGPAWALQVVDQTGRSLTLPAQPRRIVSLVPSVTEILFAIGAQEALAGVTDFCDFPAEAKRKRSVGGMISPSLEALIALKPDLVVATRSGNRSETFDQLKRLGLPVYLVDEPPTVRDVLRLVSALGELTGHKSAAAAVTADLERRIKAVGERIEGRPRPRVLYVLWPDPLIVPGRGALVSELITLAGGELVTADQGQGYPRMSLEAAVARAPEVIILASHGGGVPMARDKWERLESLPAVKSKRLYTADGSVMHRYGPRVVNGIETVAKLLHPEAFAK